MSKVIHQVHSHTEMWEIFSTALQLRVTSSSLLVSVCVTNTIFWWNFSHHLDNHCVYQAPKQGFWPLSGHGCSHHPGHPHHAMDTSHIQRNMMLAELQPRALHFAPPLPLPVLALLSHCCIFIAKTMFSLMLVNERDLHQHKQGSGLPDRAVLFAGLLWLHNLHCEENKFCFCTQRFFSQTCILAWPLLLK